MSGANLRARSTRSKGEYKEVVDEDDDYDPKIHPAKLLKPTKLMGFQVLGIIISLTYIYFATRPSVPAGVENPLYQFDASVRSPEQTQLVIDNAVHEAGCDCVPQPPLDPTHTITQVFVLGPHHSATSPLTKLLIKSGLTAGPRKGLLLEKDRQMLKYWELEKAVQRDQHIIDRYFSTHHIHDRRGPDWIGWGFDYDGFQGDLRERAFDHDVVKIVEHMDKVIVEDDYGAQGWVIKDPRMGLVATSWLKASKNAICVILLRDPIEAAFRALAHDHIPGNFFNLKEWGLIWEEYTSKSILSCLQTETPIVLVSYREFCLQPAVAMSKLYDDLQLLGVGEDRVERLKSTEVHHILGGNWAQMHKKKDALVDEYLGTIDKFKVLSPRGIAIWEMLTGNEAMSRGAPCLNCFSTAALYNKSWAGERIERVLAVEAYAVYCPDFSQDTMKKLKVLAASIMQFDSSRDLVIIVEQYTVAESTKEDLMNDGWSFYEIKKADPLIVGCVSFEDERDSPMVPVKYYQRLLDAPASTIRLITEMYNVIAFLDPSVMLTDSPDEWFKMKEEVIAEAHKEMVVMVDYQMLRKLKPGPVTTHCTYKQPSLFAKTLSASISNVCTEDEQKTAVFWDDDPAFWKSMQTDKAQCIYPWNLPMKEFGPHLSKSTVRWMFLKHITDNSIDFYD